MTLRGIFGILVECFGEDFELEDLEERLQTLCADKHAAVKKAEALERDAKREWWYKRAMDLAREVDRLKEANEGWHRRVREMNTELSAWEQKMENITRVWNELGEEL